MILLSSTKTSMHDDVFQILSMHLDPTLTLPRARMLSVLYHVLSTLHDDFPSIGQMLNDLCLGLTCSDLAQALVGIYAKEVHVRHACLTAIKCVPIHSVQQDLLVSTDLWIAVHDPEKAVAELAKDLWDRFGFDVCTDYSRIIDALSHKNYNVRAATAEALTAALDENPEKIQDMLSTLISLYLRDLGPESEFGDSNWLGRQGIALALHSVSNVLGFKDLLVIMKFLMSHGLDDRNLDVRNRMMNIVILIIDKHGKENVSLLIPIFESCLNKMATDEETHKLFRKCFRVFISGVANYVSEGDPQVHNAFEKLLDQLNTPSANPPRNMLMDLPYVPFIEHLQSVGDSLFDVVYFSEPVAVALRAGWFVSLGGIGLEFYHMLFAMIESPHSRRKCLQRFKPEDVRYIPSLKRLVLSERIREIPYSSEMYRHNVQDVGEVLRCFRYDPKKVDKHEPDIFEIQRDRSKLPPYLSTLVSEIANMGSAIDGLTPKWRSLYDLDLAGKSSAAKIALILGVDLHYDYLPTSYQKDNLRSCLGEVTSSWKDLAEAVPSLKAILDFPYWNKEEKKWDKVNYNGFSVHSLWKCGRNHQTHSNGNQLSEKEAEAIFSFLFHVPLSKITKVIIETYEEPTPDDKKKQNKIKILEILHLK